MEAYDIFADHVHVRGPVFSEKFARIAVRVVPEPRNIIAQRVQPYVNDVFIVKIDGDAPFERGARNAQILQPRLQKVVHHLVFAGYGRDELGVFVVILHQPVRIFVHAEKVSLFLCGLYLSAAVGAFSVFQLRGGPKGFAGGTVKPLVVALVDIALLVQFFEDLLHLRHMVLVRRADEFVIRHVHQVPDSFDFRRHAVHKLFRGHARGFRLFLNFLAVFVRSRLKTHVKALVALESRNGVRQHDLVSVAYVRLARSIGDGRGNVVRFFFAHNVLPPRLVRGIPIFF